MIQDYIIMNKDYIQKRIEELEKIDEKEIWEHMEFDTLKHILSQSTPLIPELQKTWNAAYIDAMSIDEETYKPLFFQDYISNLKLDI